MKDETKISELTVGELKEIIRALIQESKYQIIGVDIGARINKLPVYPDTKTTVYCNKEDDTKC